MALSQQGYLTEKFYQNIVRDWVGNKISAVIQRVGLEARATDTTKLKQLLTKFPLLTLSEALSTIYAPGGQRGTYIKKYVNEDVTLEELLEIEEIKILIADTDALIKECNSELPPAIEQRLIYKEATQELQECVVAKLNDIKSLLREIRPEKDIRPEQGIYREAASL